MITMKTPVAGVMAPQLPAWLAQAAALGNSSNTAMSIKPPGARIAGQVYGPDTEDQA